MNNCAEETNFAYRDDDVDTFDEEINPFGADTEESEIEVQLIGFLETEKIKDTSETKKKTSNIHIFLLVDRITEEVEKEISRIRENSKGIMKRVLEQTEIENTLRGEHADRSIIITDTKNKETVNEIISNLVKKKLELKLHVV